VSKPFVAFISYARDDGETTASALRSRLQQHEPEITLWQDRREMHGGRDWWRQITDALEQVRYLVLLVTPASLASPIVKQEWRYAQKVGVEVVPVNAAPGKLDFDAMPRWMRKKHFFDLDKEWERFVLQLKSPGQAIRVPFMVPDLPAGFVAREHHLRRLRELLLDGENPTRKTVALHGAGGFGKTTLAEAVCHDDDVIAAFSDGILWATLGEHPNILREQSQMFAALTGQRPAFVSEEDAANALAIQLEGRDFLIVVDDVWDPDALEALLRGDASCTRLVTTRVFDVAIVAEEVDRIEVDEMSVDEAVALLTARVSAQVAEPQPFLALVDRLGRWPLLLELAAGVLHHHVARRASMEDALHFLNEALDEEGVVAFDRRNAKQRHQAVARTVAASINLLSDDEREQFRSLAIFPEDVEVPLDAVATLLGLSSHQSTRLVTALADLSLLKLNLETSTVRLHDVMRSYLASELADAPALHERLAAAWSRVAQLPSDYAWRHVGYHMASAADVSDAALRGARTRRLVELITDAQFLRGHAERLGDPVSLAADLATALNAAVRTVDDQSATFVARAALSVQRFARDQLRPESLFELADEGKLDEAQQRLELFHPERHWRDAILATLVWRAVAAGHAEPAAALRGKLAPDSAAPDAVLGPLLARGAEEPLPIPAAAQSLPDPPAFETVTHILDRLGGTAFTPIEPLMVSGLQAMGDEAPAYLAEQDGPLLVAFAASGGDSDTQYLKRYIALQANNSYQYYRNMSLWMLFPPVLCHPDAPWVLDILRDIISGALTPTRIEFGEALPSTLLGLAAAAGDDAALQTLERIASRLLSQRDAMSPARGQGDPWAACMRHLSVLAEVHALLLGRQADAEHLLEAAQSISFDLNFAGFRAPACLRLAETLRICTPDATAAIDEALEQALAAAHNIQDADFCLQMSARVNAMRERWWPFPMDGVAPGAIIEHFVEAPGDGAFGCLHRIGENLAHRVSAETRLPIPDAFRDARTLDDIARLYHCESPEAPAQLLAMNRDAAASADAPLAEGSWVRVPDPSFAPALAARFSAELLASSPGMETARSRALLQQLVPVATRDGTELDTVLARLLMHAQPTTLQPVLSLR
jgi:hypothetical protein